MLTLMHFLRRIVPIIAMFAIGVSGIRAQEEESAETKQYREDYERIQKVMTITDQVKRADQLLLFLKERSNSKMTQYAQDNYMLVLDNMLKQKNNVALMALSKRMIEARPRLGEPYYFYGVALRNDIKRPEAMDAFAKCVALKSKLSARARQDLEALYKLQNGNLNGIDNYIKKAQDEIEK
jgi:hypothetical protein